MSIVDRTSGSLAAAGGLPRATSPWRRFVPWQGRATRLDLALMGAILGVVALGLVLRPLKPFLLASHPVMLAFLTGVPSAAVYAAAGLAGMRLVTFLMLDLAGAVAMTGLVAGLGYGLGHQAVGVVLLIDRYASVVSLTMIAVAALIPVLKRLIGRRHGPLRDVLGELRAGG